MHPAQKVDQLLQMALLRNNEVLASTDSMRHCLRTMQPKQKPRSPELRRVNVRAPAVEDRLHQQTAHTVDEFLLWQSGGSRTELQTQLENRHYR